MSMRYCTKSCIFAASPSRSTSRPSHILASSLYGAPACMFERPGLPSNCAFDEPRLPAGSSELPVMHDRICSARTFWMEFPFWSVASWKWMPPLPCSGFRRVV